jgi:hypothetical protein
MPRTNRKQIEDFEQQVVVQWAHYHWFGKYLFAIPNGGHRHKVVAAKLKKQGVKAGVSDLFLSYPSKGYHGLFIEMKRENKKLARVSPLQDAFLEQQKEVGYAGEVAYGAMQAIKIIKDYLEIEK